MSKYGIKTISYFYINQIDRPESGKQVASKNAVACLDITILLRGLCDLRAAFFKDASNSFIEVKRRQQSRWRMMSVPGQDCHQAMAGWLLPRWGHEMKQHVW